MNNNQTNNQRNGNNGQLRAQTLAKGEKLAHFYNLGLTWPEAIEAAGVRVTPATARYYAQEWAKATGGTLRVATERNDSAKDNAMKAYILHINNGATNEEIANILGYSKGHVRELIERGRRMAARKEETK